MVFAGIKKKGERAGKNLFKILNSFYNVCKKWSATYYCLCRLFSDNLTNLPSPANLINFTCLGTFVVCCH